MGAGPRGGSAACTSEAGFAECEAGDTRPSGGSDTLDQREDLAPQDLYK